MIQPALGSESSSAVASGVDAQRLMAPTAAAPFFQFASLLRANDFSVASEQTQSFIHAVGLLGPKSMSDIYYAAHATFAPVVERRAEFDALYRLVFLGHSLTGAATGDTDDEDELQALDERDGQMDSPEANDVHEVGEQASGTENLSLRTFSELTESEALRRFKRLAPAYLPQRKTVRRKPAKAGDRWDMRRSLRDAVKRDGEVLNIPRLQRRYRQRRILLAIDISGSMKAQTESYLRFAHTLSSLTDQLEVFTLGTRLTRVTRVLRIRSQQQALSTASTLVADWDGGTRLGDALNAFLSVPRFAGFARGAFVIVLSDGLERGDHTALLQAVERVSRLCWRLDWLTPLAADSAYVPQTEAMQALLPHINQLGDGSNASSLCAHIIDTSRTPT